MGTESSGAVLCDTKVLQPCKRNPLPETLKKLLNVFLPGNTSKNSRGVIINDNPSQRNMSLIVLQSKMVAGLRNLHLFFQATIPLFHLSVYTSLTFSTWNSDLFYSGSVHVIRSINNNRIKTLHHNRIPPRETR